ncbi:MAG: single-stranded DNA-binding protein [Rhodospirillaceae bacterium]|nr:MAG: single-stranded DNA-binding protein [Rhodospirillaceae bacterium]
MTETQKKQETVEKIKMNVYQCINAVQAELAKTGIGKDRKTTGGTIYSFRGIDDIYNALSQLMAKHGLCIIPVLKERNVIERQSKGGGALFYTTVTMDYQLVSAHDSSSVTMTIAGEAMDSSDKATNKALSAAYKYACLQIFCIPVKGETVDSENENHEVKLATVTEEQEMELCARAEKHGQEYVAKFLKYMKVEGFDRILANDYSKAVRALDKKNEASKGSSNG